MSNLSAYQTDELLEELESRGFKVAIKIKEVQVECWIGDKEFDVVAT